MSGKALHYSPWRLIKVAVLCGIGAAGFGYLAAYPRAIQNHIFYQILGSEGFLVIAGLCAFGVLLPVFTLGNLLALRIETGGLLVRSLFSTRTVAWNDLADLTIRQWTMHGRDFVQLRIVRKAASTIDINLHLLSNSEAEVEDFIDEIGRQQRAALSYRPPVDQDAQPAPQPRAGFGRKVVR